jgi:hypothetical protein
MNAVDYNGQPRRTLLSGQAASFGEKGNRLVDLLHRAAANDCIEHGPDRAV